MTTELAQQIDRETRRAGANKHKRLAAIDRILGDAAPPASDALTAPYERYTADALGAEVTRRGLTSDGLKAGHIAALEADDAA